MQRSKPMLVLGYHIRTMLDEEPYEIQIAYG
jgi:hypothetical protein